MLNDDIESSFSAAICDAIKGLVVLLDPQGRILRWNRRCEEVCGYSLEEIQHVPCWEILLPPEDRERARAAFEGLLGSLSSDGQEESWWLARDGSRRFLTWATTVLRGKDGDARYVLASGIDITERKSASDALAEREQRLSHAMEGSKDGFWEWDLRTGQIQFTARAAAILGYESHEIAPHIDSFFGSLHPDDEAAARSAITGHLQGLTPYYEGECRMREKDGEWKWVVFSGRVVARGEGGTPLRLGGSVMDISERKRAEQALRDSEERHRALFDNNPHPIWVVEIKTGRLLAANEAAVRQYGYSREEFARMRIGEICSTDSAAGLEAVRERVAAGEPCRHESRHCTKSGRVLDVEIFCHPFVYCGQLAGLMLAHDVTARKRAEEARSESESRYQDLVNNLSLGVYRTTPDGRTLMANPALVRMMGYSSFEELAARNLEKNGFEVESPRWRFRRLVEEKGTITYDARWRRVDGSILFVREHAKAIRGGDGRVLYYEGVVEDVTEKKRAEEALRENEERFRHLFEEAPVAYHEIDSDGIVRAVNQAECALLGLRKEQILNRPVWEFAHPGERERARQSIGRKLSGQQPLEPFHREYLHANGSSRFCEIHESLLHDAAGAVIGMRAAVVDVTERKRVEQALRWSEARFRAVFEGSALGIFTTDLLGRLTAINPAMERLLGYAQEELRGVHFSALAVAEDRERDAPFNRALFAGECEHLQLEKRYVCKSGLPLWVRVTISLVRDGEGRPDFVIGMIEDITERKRAEDALRRTIEELARSNAELEHFAYVASHDLQEPLRMVTSFMQLLRARYKGKLDSDADEFITYAVEGASRMKSLIDDLLSYSRVGTRGKPFLPTESRYAVEQAAANLAVAIDESGAVVSIDDSLPLLMADAGQLVQLFQNLIGNAVKFRATRRPEIRVTAERRDGTWAFSVRDNGIGIEERHRERIFEIFARLHTKEEYPGSGIGLAVSKKIVERHGGTMGVTSEPGAGSAFWFTIPDKPIQEE